MGVFVLRKGGGALTDQTIRLHITITGVVQGVGFRPFIYRLALETGVSGLVNNSSQGVVIEIEGLREKVETFLRRIETDKPPRALIQSLHATPIAPIGDTTFIIQPTDATGDKTTLILPDVAACPDCLRECFDPTNRRYLYPFTNCTNCGPRFTIIEALPYDRPNTTMKQFVMCDDCRAEYENPLDRRFHAQPNACPVCGPQLELWGRGGVTLAIRHDALLAAADAIRQGQVVALKGLGGFQLLVDARNEEAVKLLRTRKRREEKPFALMFPSLTMAQAHCEVSELEMQLLLSPEAPIVLLRRKIMGETPLFSDPYPQPFPRKQGKGAAGAQPAIHPLSVYGAVGAQRAAPSGGWGHAIAPNNPYLGVMLPYTPLHHILMAELGFPVVATSGNLSDEPICIDEYEALERLGNIADGQPVDAKIF